MQIMSGWSNENMISAENKKTISDGKEWEYLYLNEPKRRPRGTKQNVEFNNNVS